MKVIDEKLLNEVSEQAKASPRRRKNYNFHQSLNDKCHRLSDARPLSRLGHQSASTHGTRCSIGCLNAVEPGTEVPVHRHPTKDETFVILRGKVKVLTYNDEGRLLEDVVLSHEDGRYGVDIPKGVWHTIEAMESSVIFEVKEGPFVPHEDDGILDVEKK